MTSPAPITDATTAAAASPALGADPDRDSTVATDSAADVATPAVYGVIDPDSDDVVIATKTPTVGVFFDADGRQHYASPVSKATQRNLADGTWSTEAPEPAEPFDPSKAHVDVVVAYLNEHAHDQDEIARVREAEAAGKNRVTIRDWPPAQ